MEENQNQSGQLQLELRPEIAQGEYVNLAVLTHSSSEFVIDMARVVPGLPKAQVRSRVILAPEHAKRLLLALQDNIAKYEQVYGRIELSRAQPRTISPFNQGKGEA